MKKRVQWLGLQRSGTSWITALCCRNFDLHTGEKDQNKHLMWMPERCKSDCAVVVVKNPYAWLLSYHRLAKLRNGDLRPFPRFLREPLEYAADGRHQRARTPAEYYCGIILQWLSDIMIPWALVRYEDALKDWRKELERLERELGWGRLPATRNELRPMDQEMGPLRYRRSRVSATLEVPINEGSEDRVELTGDFPQSRRRYYETCGWISEYGSDDLRFVNGQLEQCRRLMDRLGYRIEMA